MNVSPKLRDKISKKVAVTNVISKTTHHINYLLESNSKREHEGGRLVEDGPVQGVVVGEKGAQQPLLLGSSYTFCNTLRLSKNVLQSMFVMNIKVIIYIN
jgi:hypothetical protein